MGIIYTKHAEDKLERIDIRKFKITRKIIANILNRPTLMKKTRYGEFLAIGTIDSTHVLRIIHVIINLNIKVITFYVTRKDRYES